MPSPMLAAAGGAGGATVTVAVMVTGGRAGMVTVSRGPPVVMVAGLVTAAVLLVACCRAVTALTMPKVSTAAMTAIAPMVKIFLRVDMAGLLRVGEGGEAGGGG